MDADGRPLRPIILHLDRRSYRQAQWALQKVGEDAFLNIAGNLPIPGGISATSLLWVRDHEPEIYSKKDICFGHAVTFFLKRLTKKVLTPNKMPETRFYPYLTGDRHRIKRKSGAFTRMTLNTGRDDLLLALANGIIAFQIESISEWKKQVRLSSEIYHVGGGASDAYTGYKQSLLKNYRFVQLGETTLTGAAKLASEAIK